jgi:hypothetical protein
MDGGKALDESRTSRFTESPLRALRDKRPLSRCLKEISPYFALATKRLSQILLRTFRSLVAGVDHRYSTPLPTTLHDDLTRRESTTTGSVASAAAKNSVRELTEAGLVILQLQAEASLPDSWVNRRVEQLEFLDTRSVRWRSSIDFVVPADAPMIVGNTRLIPVTSASKGSLVAFDMRDECGGALWLPTSEWASRRFGSALSAMASRILGDALPDAVRNDLVHIVSNDAGHRAAFETFAPRAPFWMPKAGTNMREPSLLRHRGFSSSRPDSSRSASGGLGSIAGIAHRTN